MKFWILILLILCCDSLSCNNYYQDEFGCIHSSGIACRWESTSNQCLQSSSTKQGCLNYLNQEACVAQTFYPNKNLAQCIFSGYCRPVVVNPDDCANNLSRAACLGISQTYCIWSNGCQRVSDPSTIASSSVLTTEMQQSSVSICQLITGFPVIHQNGVHEVLTTLYRTNLLNQEVRIKFEQQLLIPGCFEPSDEIFDKITCEAGGLNSLGCMKVRNGKCIFKNGFCQTITDSSTLECSQRLNKNGCLSVTNFAQTCYWNQNYCATYNVLFTTECELNIQVSPSVCANISYQECFYDSATMQCNGLCRSDKSRSKASACTSSQYNCITDYYLVCTFADGKQCDRLGQNKLACQNANQNCHFMNGFCKSIDNLNLLSCSNGLNSAACNNLSNASQVCQFGFKNGGSIGECFEVQITPNDKCEDLGNVNYNACKKATTGGCYWKNGVCKNTIGTEECTTLGLNKIGCLSTNNSIKACKWDDISGSCKEQDVSSTDNCASLKLVNAVACRRVTYVIDGTSKKPEFCRYNSNKFSCEVFQMDSSIECSTAGLNKIACTSISNSKLSCRWLGNQCINVESLGNAVTCISLESVTQRTCSLIQTETQKCKFDSTRSGCSTTVPPTLDCSEPGLNGAGCASLSKSCYFDTDNDICTAADTAYATITCDTNWPSKIACLSITTQQQYCRWDSNNKVCKLQVFPVSDNCSKFTNVNRQFCQAYQVAENRVIGANHYCIYNSESKSCDLQPLYLSDCGTNLDINLHACVSLTNSSLYCYFDSSTLRCTEMANPTASDSKLHSISCKMGNRTTCLQLLTPQQYCVWWLAELRCLQQSTGKNCLDFNTGYQINPQFCASTKNDKACMFDKENNNCKVALITDLSYSCLEPGLNENACINNTNEACYFDKVNFKCLNVTSDNAQQKNCTDSLNQKGCLTSLKEACYWNTNSCAKVTSVSFNTVTCQSLNNQLYNAIVCASVTTPGQQCLYNSVTSHCEQVAGTQIKDCKPGYNINTCSLNSNCQSWDSSTNICRILDDYNICKSITNELLCLATKLEACVWVNSKCKKVYIDENTTCDDLSKQNQQKYNQRVCLSVYKSGEYCQYDAATSLCQKVLTDNNDCSIPGLNRQGCMLKTKGHYCIFQWDWNSQGCSELTDVSDLTCSSQINIDACLSVTLTQCAFYLLNSSCDEYSKNYVYSNWCDDYTFSDFLVTSNFCKYSGGDNGCVYDSTKRICKIDNSILIPQCSSLPDINSSYCHNNVLTQTCKFDIEQGICQEFDPTISNCSDCTSFKQCAHSTVSTCQWQLSKCVSANLAVPCDQLHNVNSLTCMAVVNGDEKCQFQEISNDASITTSCIVPSDDIQSCSGLNKVACLANTANSCYFYLGQCIDITIQPFQAKCTPDYSFTQSGCLKIKTPLQLCKWDNNTCVTTTKSDQDTCATYVSPIYSALVCASIAVGNCYWNNGCVSGTASTCETLGANKGACIGASSGSCIFSSGVCLDVKNPTPLIKNFCTDPTNQNGCLNLDNGEPCKWNGTSCEYADSASGCFSQINVNPGACSSTTDVACKWVNNQCQGVYSSITCSVTGLNKIGCLTLTTFYYCYYDNKERKCLSIDDINVKNCTDNINQKACLEHPSKCCQWANGECSNSTSGQSCTALTQNSAYCCISLTGDKCTFDSAQICSQLTEQSASCSSAVNLQACMWIDSSCRWDTSKLSCLSVSMNYGCKPNMNAAACIFQNIHCKFLNNECVVANTEDKCDDLATSSLSSKMCVQIRSTECQLKIVNQKTVGCQVPSYHAACDSQLNYLACANNANNCIFNYDIDQCMPITISEKLATCPGDLAVSIGYCSQSKEYCIYNEISLRCQAYDISWIDFYLCDQRNAVQPSQSIQCTVFQDSICQYDPDNIRCTSTIIGTACEVIINQYGCKYIQNNCYWDNNTCKQYPTYRLFNTCESIFSKYQCLNNVSTACTWSNSQNTCITYQEQATTCSQLTNPLTSKGVCYFFSTDFCAHDGTRCYLEIVQNGCANSKSPLGCQANTSGNCYWNITYGYCSELTVNLAANMTCFALKYSNKPLCLASIMEGQLCHWKNSLCQNANIQDIGCNFQISLNACRAVARSGEQCIFTSACGYTNNTTTKCSDYLNIYGCLAVLEDGQYCVWSGQQCQALNTKDGFELGTHTLINANACRKASAIAGQPQIKDQEPLAVKYDKDNYLCQNSDTKSDLCSTPGLNYYGCLLTEADSCEWDSNASKCIPFDFDVTYTLCNQYQQVSPKVCASITATGQECQHNSKTLSCETFLETEVIFKGDQFINSKTGMNRLACINVINQPTIWINGICSYNQVKPALTTCGQLIDVNAKSCAQIDKMDITCKYDRDGKCTTRFDGTIDKCTTPGLNRIACVQIEKQRCIFINGSCQVQWQSDREVCGQLRNVNALVCSQVIHQPCKFSLVNRGCVDVYYSEKCNAEGINALGCKAQSSCSWINQQCYCKGQVQRLSLIDCSLLHVAECTIKQCIVANEQCKNINCSDLTTTQCTGAAFGKIKCFLNNGICTTASKCTDLFNVTCPDFTFNGSKCIPDIWNSNHCVEWSCAYLTQDSCSGNCTWSQYECVIKECNYMKKELCYGIMNNQQCYWDGSYCQALSSCQDYMSYQATQTEKVCESQTILNKKCNWKLIKPYGNDYECTSSICSAQGQSLANCHGSETQNEVCILLPDYSCVACPEIEDQCACMAINYCQYNDNVGCFSNPCSNLNQETCVANVERCQYINEQCKPTCSKLKQIECINRQTINECHWNSDISACLNGVEEIININTLADVIVIQNTYSSLLGLGAIILFIQ